MALIDFTIKGNTQIRSYFEGSNEYLPSSEFIYLHEHPMITTSFLQEIEIIINTTCLCLAENKTSGKILETFISHTRNLGALLPDVNEVTTPKILAELRTIYQYCISLLKHYNFK